MKIKIPRPGRNQGGYSLLLVTSLVAVSLIILGATMRRTATSAKLNDRSNLYINAGAAAEAATEKALALLRTDFDIGGEARVQNSLSKYQTNIPSGSENTNWLSYEFSDAKGHVNQTFVERTSTSSAGNASYVALNQQYAGLKGFASTYRILSNARVLNSIHGNTLVNAVQMDLQLAEIPIFQFAVFYNGLMEYTWCATFNIRGLVHANGDIYVGSTSPLTFFYNVTTTGKISSPAWDGHQMGEYNSKLVSYLGTPSPGYKTGVPTLTLPIGTTNTPAALHQIIELPPSGENINSALAYQRFYNKAGMTIILSGSNNITINLKPSPFSAGQAVDWTNANYFISTNIAFLDGREGMSNLVTQIDVGKFKTWAGTDKTVSNMFSSSNPLNIIYVADLRTVGAGKFTAVRLINGVSLPSAGLTVATPNPLYVLGNYNCPNSSHLNTTDTSATAPASLICDALTLLSPSWSDTKCTNGLSARIASKMTLNAAIIAGCVYSTGPGATTYSGGVNNLPRLLEDWSPGGVGIVLTLNTSIVNLYNSTAVTHQFQNPGAYYKAPSRDFNFDQNFNFPDKLPPGTPAMRQIVRSSWCNPPPNTTNYVYSTNSIATR
ncbi:MAG: hypothetical protein JWQ71_1465 [Pedosphaera sp.]|nr:hypothetical protein [Pedosphaera sp.]